MNFLTTKNENLASIMNIIFEAQVYLASKNINQWQNGYPNEKEILADIANHDSFIVKDEANTILGLPT